jgi:hypothetical protein
MPKSINSLKRCESIDRGEEVGKVLMKGDIIWVRG